MKFTKENAAAVLKKARTDSGFSAKDVVKKLKESDIDISTKTLYGYENAHSSPTAKTMFKLCDIYGIDINSALGFEEKEKPTTKNGDGLDERLSIFSTLSPESQKQALDFLDFLAQRESAKDKE